jgi:hypothetical protein
MTKVELTYPLTKPLDEHLLRRLGDVHAIYGIHRIEVDPDLKSLRVGYDASRLTPKDVEGALRRAGIPLAAAQQ